MNKNKLLMLIGAGVVLLGIVASIYVKQTPSITEGNTISISQQDDGLVIKGTVQDGDFQYVNISVSDVVPLKLPPIGWGNQFGTTVLSNETDCNGYQTLPQKIQDPAACKAWYEKQIQFREEFAKLFTRSWHLTATSTTEIYATPALNSFPMYVQQQLSALAVGTSSIPVLKLRDARHFEVTIHWQDLPPISSLSLKSLHVAIDTGSKAGTNSTSTEFILPHERDYTITSCHYPLDTGSNHSGPVFSDMASTYILPGNDTTLSNILVFDNTILGYQYDPSASSTSPTVYTLSYFQKTIQPGEFICGPQLTYSKDGSILTTSAEINNDVMEVKHLSPTEVLVRSGPSVYYSYYGSGQCGGCARGSFIMEYLNLKDATSTEAYAFDAVFDENDSDFTISSDWKKISEYDYGPPEDTDNPYDSSSYSWTRTDYCFNDTTHIYDVCGVKKNINPPSPRNFEPPNQG